MSGAALQPLLDTIAGGRAILFTGAGFSSDARDVDGEPLPDGEQMRNELWSLCFGACECDHSTLSDLYDVALARLPRELEAYVQRRLRIGTADVPAHVARWFAAPWLRIYTLNVDDLEVAIARQYELPRPLHTRSALDGSFGAARPGDDLEVIHLNGVASAAPTELTFSTLQYASRLCGGDPAYTMLVEDLLRSPFVFAGTTLDEVILWQHVEMRRRHRDVDLASAPRSYLITPSLTRARRELLDSLGITWVRATIEEVATHFPGWRVRRSCRRP